MWAIYLTLLLLVISPTSARRSGGGWGGGHRSGGSHSYPSSSGHSGTGTKITQTYSASNSIEHHSSVGGSVGHYGGGSHSYPSSTGLSGSGTKISGTYSASNRIEHHSNVGSNVGHSSSGSHTYPSSTGFSGSGAKISNTASNGNLGHSYSGQNHAGNNVYNTHHQTTYQHKTEVHHHYHYNPPQQLNYGPKYFPVYHSRPPVYVYEYRDSGSRFDTLLTGLALYNLGRMSSNSQYHTRNEYTPRKGEKCILGIQKQNGDYEEVSVNCKLMSTFIWEAESRHNQQVVQNSITTVVNVNGDSSVSATVQNNQVIDALQARGPSIKVTPGMYCFMKRITYESVMKQEVDCGLLQAYAHNSFHINKSVHNGPVVFLILLKCFLFYICTM